MGAEYGGAGPQFIVDIAFHGPVSAYGQGIGDLDPYVLVPLLLGFLLP